MYRRWKSNYQDGKVEILFTGLTLPHCYTCPKPGHGFSKSCVVVLCCAPWIKIRGDYSIVDVDEIVYHDCLNFLFIHVIL